MWDAVRERISPQVYMQKKIVKYAETQAVKQLVFQEKKHETGFEPAALALARRCSTTEPLVHII